MMQVAREVCRILKQNPNAIQTEQFRISFKAVKAQPIENQDITAITKVAKSRWFGFLGIKRKK